MDEKEKKEGLIKDSYELIIKELQSIITLFYLLLVAIGMLFNHFKYSEFGINIFQYADIFDFMIAPFQDIIIVIFTLLSILIPFIGYKLDIYWKTKKPEQFSKYNLGMDKKNWYKIVHVVVLTIGILFGLLASGTYYGKYSSDKIKNGPTLTIKLSDNQEKTGLLIGKTKDYIFMLLDEDVKAYPIGENVKEIYIK